MIVSAFYLYVDIKNPVEVRASVVDCLKSSGCTGRILLGYEGINGSVCGTAKEIAAFEKQLSAIDLFSTIRFKQQPTELPAFKKQVVRIRKTIVNFDHDVDLKNTGDFIEPADFKKMLDDNEDVILVDMRNNYESHVGKFKNAITPDMDTFRDMPQKIKELKGCEDKKIVTYCTGGIRCEKASAYLKENGFSNVSQLKGGIIAYGNEFPEDTHWEGTCFVFDRRLTVPVNNNPKKLNTCSWCDEPCDDYTNCYNLTCDKLFICCDTCKQAHNHSCSVDCESVKNRRSTSQAL